MGAPHCFKRRILTAKSSGPQDFIVWLARFGYLMLRNLSKLAIC
jgi:hypothetical protein